MTMPDPRTDNVDSDASGQTGVSLDQQQQSLYERTQLLQAILNTATDAIVTINERGLILIVNPAAEKMFGYTPSELVGQNVKLLMPEPYCELHDGYLARHRETLQSRIIGFARELVARRKDGSIFPISLSVSQVDHLGLFTGIVRDLSPIKELQRHVLQIAEEEQRRIGLELHDGVAQELTGTSLFVRGLLNRLDRFTQVVSNQAHSTSEQAALLEEIRDVAARIGKQLEETHQHVRALSHGMMPVQIDGEGLRAALEELVETASISGGPTCVFAYSPPVTGLSPSTATHLFRIAQEAVNNSIRHGQAHQIVVQLESLDGHILLVIADDGIGVSTSQRSLGSKNGSGLRTMYYRANLIGAHLEIDTPPAGGTCVRCILAREHQRP